MRECKTVKLVLRAGSISIEHLSFLGSYTWTVHYQPYIFSRHNDCPTFILPQFRVIPENVFLLQRSLLRHPNIGDTFDRLQLAESLSQNFTLKIILFCRLPNVRSSMWWEYVVLAYITSTTLIIIIIIIIINNFVYTVCGERVTKVLKFI
jgi:hypothetical protein